MKTQHLLLLANRYAAHRGLTLSTVSTYAANDGKYFRKMAEGAGCTLRTAERLTTWFSENWPDDLVWPTDIPRPVDVTLTRTPEALSPHCLLETCASGNLAGGVTPPPVTPPAPLPGFFDVGAAKEVLRARKLREARREGLYRAANTWSAQKVCSLLLRLGVIEKVTADPLLSGAQRDD